MKTELLNEFYLMQQSRSNTKYLDILDEKVYVPVKQANSRMVNWMSDRGIMLMKLDHLMNRHFRRFKKKYLKF